MSIAAKLKFERTDIMEKITTIEIDADKVSLFNARLNKFGDLLTEKSDCLIEYCETANLITKRLYLETESLRVSHHPGGGLKRNDQTNTSCYKLGVA
ncbi:MAG: hypothetical protein QG556_499 [Pseudomonadota bacterium]|nr:hypothetical protein [Pseudomonadota bacterium]